MRLPANLDSAIRQNSTRCRKNDAFQYTRHRQSTLAASDEHSGRQSTLPMPPAECSSGRSPRGFVEGGANGGPRTGWTMCSLGPLLDRIHLHIEVPAVPFAELSATSDGTNTASMREAVFRARAVQDERFGTGAGATNSRMSPRQLRKHCQLDPDCQGL